MTKKTFVIIVILLITLVFISALFVSKNSNIKEDDNHITEESDLSFTVFLEGLRDVIANHCIEARMEEERHNGKYDGFSWIGENDVDLIKGYRFTAQNWNIEMMDKCGDPIVSYLEQSLELNERNTEKDVRPVIRGLERGNIKCMIFTANLSYEFVFECGDISENETPQDYKEVYLLQNPSLDPFIKVSILYGSDGFVRGGLGNNKNRGGVAFMMKKEDDEWRTIFAGQGFFDCETIFKEDVPVLSMNIESCWSIEREETWVYDEDRDQWETIRTGESRSEKDLYSEKRMENLDMVRLFNITCDTIIDSFENENFCILSDLERIPLRYDWIGRNYINSWWEDADNTNDILPFVPRQQSISRLQYLDINGDGQSETIISIHGGGTGGSYPFQVFKLSDGGDIVQVIEVERKEENYDGARGHVSFKVENGNIIEFFPVYAEDDANCCPSLGQREITFIWDNGKLISE